MITAVVFVSESSKNHLGNVMKDVLCMQLAILELNRHQCNSREYKDAKCNHRRLSSVCTKQRPPLLYQVIGQEQRQFIISREIIQMFKVKQRIRKAFL